MRFPEFSGEWEKGKFNKYITLLRGSSPRPIQEYLTKDDSGVNWIKIGDTKNVINHHISQVDEKITAIGATKSREVFKGDLILANSMSFGKTYELDINGCIYDGWFVLRNYNEYFYKPFLHQLLNSEYMQGQYRRLSTGGIVQNISSDIVYETILSRPKLVEQQKIASFLSLIDERITTQIKIIEELKILKKALREKIYNQFMLECNHLPIGSILDYEQPTKYIVYNDSYSNDKSLTPVLTANKTFILGYTDEVTGIYDKGNSIIFDDFTMDSKFVDFNFKVKSLAIKILTAKPTSNTYFVFEYLQFLKLIPNGHKRHYLSEVANIRVGLPDIEKQFQVVDTLSHIDVKIKTESEFERLYVQQKQYLLSNLFI